MCERKCAVQGRGFFLAAKRPRSGPLSRKQLFASVRGSGRPATTPTVTPALRWRHAGVTGLASRPRYACVTLHHLAAGGSSLRPGRLQVSEPHSEPTGHRRDPHSYPSALSRWGGYGQSHRPPGVGGSRSSTVTFCSEVVATSPAKKSANGVEVNFFSRRPAPTYWSGALLAVRTLAAQGFPVSMDGAINKVGLQSLQELLALYPSTWILALGCPRQRARFESLGIPSSVD